jgi:hypothetical protein
MENSSSLPTHCVNIKSYGWLNTKDTQSLKFIMGENLVEHYFKAEKE